MALQSAHRKLPVGLQEVRLSLERRLQDTIRFSTPEGMSRTAHSEHTALMTLHRIDTTEPHPLNDLPLIVLTRGLNSGPRWRTWQADLTRLSTKGTQIVVDDSDHEIHLFRPDVVIRAIQDVQGSAARPR